MSKYAEQYSRLTESLMEFFQEKKQNENIVISPLSIMTLLAIAADASTGKSKDEIISLIGEEVMKVEQNSSLKSSNAVCVKESIRDTITEGYEKHLKETFDGKLFASEDIVRDVNAWVKEKTNGMIEEAADDSMNNMAACLLNAIAFEAEWMEEYTEDDIYEEEFHNADGSVTTVQMMYSTEDSYIEDESFTGFIKPYKDEKYAFMALLPKKNSTCKKIDFTRLFQSASEETVHVRMPEFRYDFKEDLTETCKKLGIQTIFTPAADFSPLTSAPLQMEAVIHKAHIEVDSHGTKASAMTMAVVAMAGIPAFDFKKVRLDRPFAYAIMDTGTGLPVFTGIYNQAE